jgi:hypothetical protein
MITIITTRNKLQDPGKPGPGKILFAGHCGKWARYFLYERAHFFVFYVGLSVFWQFESLDGDLEGRYLSIE